MAALFPRPSAKTLAVARARVDLACPVHGQGVVDRYPALRVHGWKMISRCRECLLVLAEEEPPTPLGFSYVPNSLHLDRA